MRLARGTPAWVGLLWVSVVLARRTWPRVALLALASSCTWFFRDPERTPDRLAEPGDLLSPADGRVIVRDQLDDGRWQLAIYLDLLDVHVTRAPLEGELTAQHHRPGSHRPAFTPESHTNEHLTWQFDTPAGPITLIQYAGTLARRIVAYLGPGARVRRGQRIGLIRFGSRVDVVLPSRCPPLPRVGERVRGGCTVLARAVDETAT